MPVLSPGPLPAVWVQVQAQRATEQSRVNAAARGRMLFQRLLLKHGARPRPTTPSGIGWRSSGGRNDSGVGGPPPLLRGGSEEVDMPPSGSLLSRFTSAPDAIPAWEVNHASKSQNHPSTLEQALMIEESGAPWVRCPLAPNFCYSMTLEAEAVKAAVEVAWQLDAGAGTTRSKLKQIIGLCQAQDTHTRTHHGGGRERGLSTHIPKTIAF